MTTDVIDTGVDVIRTGLIGGGFMGAVHAASARAAGAHLVGIAATSPQSAQTAARRLGIERAEVDSEALITASDIDLVHICTPNDTHAALALAALRARRHVVCEKPLAVDVADARRLAATAEEVGVVTGVPFVYRYHPMVREARAMLATGEAGALLSLDCAYLQDWMLLPGDDDWRTRDEAGGPSRAFADIGSHLCDLIEFVAGERIARLTARTRIVHDQRGGRAVANEDIAAVLVETESGALGTLLVSQTAAGRKNALTIELHAAGASVRFEQERPEELWVGGRDGSRLLLRDPATARGSSRLHQLPAGHPMGYQDAFTAFVADVHDAIRGGTPEGLPTFADGLRAAILTRAVLDAAGSREWVEVPA